MIKCTTKEDQSDFHEVVSKNGLKIKLRRPTTSEKVNFSNVIGDKDDHGNLISSEYRLYHHCLLWVKEIDGLPQAPLNNKIVKEALIKKLGDDGWEAVFDGVIALMEALNETETLEAVKK